MKTRTNRTIENKLDLFRNYLVAYIPWNLMRVHDFNEEEKFDLNDGFSKFMTRIFKQDFNGMVIYLKDKMEGWKDCLIKRYAEKFNIIDATLQITEVEGQLVYRQAEEDILQFLLDEVRRYQKLMKDNLERKKIEKIFQIGIELMIDVASDMIKIKVDSKADYSSIYRVIRLYCCDEGYSTMGFMEKIFWKGLDKLESRGQEFINKKINEHLQVDLKIDDVIQILTRQKRILMEQVLKALWREACVDFPEYKNDLPRNIVGQVFDYEGKSYYLAC